jgi:hypothetical protein
MNDSSRQPSLIKRVWYHTTFFNISILSICAFIAPGLWAAMNGLGGAGAADPTYINAANAVIFCLQVVICIFGSSLIAKIGIPWALVMGMIGQPIYSASIYCNIKYGNRWFIMLACVINGVTSGMFWLTEGAIVLAYPEKHRRGRYLAFWLASRIIGQMVGGAVTLGVNVDGSTKGHISVQTYLIFISIQALGPFIASSLSRPEKVQRSDETSVHVELPTSLKVELKAMGKLLCRKEVLLLTPMIFQSVFSEAFFSTYNATYFTVRSRALGSLVASACVIVANFSLGFFLDWRKLSVNTRAVYAFVFIYLFESSLYVYAMINTKHYESLGTPTVLDWTDDGFGRGVCLYILMLVGFNLMYDYLYWLIGIINRSGGEIIRLSAVIRGIESAGQAISYGINSIDQDQFPLSGAVAVNLSFFAACIIPSAFVIWKAGIVNGIKVNEIVQDEQGDQLGGQSESDVVDVKVSESGKETRNEVVA